jgi:hypothetical protein
MPSPILPADFRFAIPSPTDSACFAFEKLFGWPAKVHAHVAWKYKSDGTLSDEFLASIVDAPANADSLGTVTGVYATTDRTTDITVSWTGVTGALSYTLYRGTSEAPESWEELATELTELAYTDTGATQDRTYWYTVKARNATKVSEEFAEAAEGRRPAGSGLRYENENPLRTVTFAVPAGKTAMEVRIWGGGGNGGYFSGSGSANGATWYGGGGASGSFLRVTGITIAEGETYVLKVGKKSATSTEADSYIFKTAEGSGDYAYATGGGDGANDTGPHNAVGGAAAASYGTKTLDGSVEADSTVGTAGENGVSPNDGTGASAEEYDGDSGGAGANGVKTRDGVRYGSAGRVIAILT